MCAVIAPDRCIAGFQKQTIGFTHVAIEYDLPLTAFGFGKLTPVFAVPPGIEIAVEGSFCSGPATPNLTDPTYVPLTAVVELSNAVGPVASVNLKYCAGALARTAEA